MTTITNQVLSEVNAGIECLHSTLGRHLARAIETKFVADAMSDWILEFKLGEPVCAEFKVPEQGSGFGLWCAPRGALGHWIEIAKGVVSRYQAVVPTTWNCSPRDDRDQPGPLEMALVGTRVRDTENPIEILRTASRFMSFENFRSRSRSGGSWGLWVSSRELSFNTIPFCMYDSRHPYILIHAPASIFTCLESRKSLHRPAEWFLIHKHYRAILHQLNYYEIDLCQPEKS